MRETVELTCRPGQLTVPNANLDKSSPVQTSARQSGEAYRTAQDVTAPPEPVAPGSTSDVPIHGEKTNVLFHPTPSVSFEPMFAAIETRATALCAGIFASIVLIGSIFGGRLWGLVPLGACVASAVFLFMKDLITRGRDLEWSSERQRGEMAVVNLIPESVEWLNTALGLIWGLINPDMFAAVADTLEVRAALDHTVEHLYRLFGSSSIRLVPDPSPEYLLG
jgi:Ca2+-dependent lipid-binding protein